MNSVSKILYVATVDYHFEKFHLPYLRWFKEQGWEVHIAAKGSLELPYVDRKFDLPFERSPFKLGNIKVWKKLDDIIDQEQYSIIHCHTPMGGVLGRLAARKARRRGTKVLYTAHGFHFCKGAPLLNWLIYYPIESLLATMTDCLITINSEDYQLAVSRGFRSSSIERVNGVGVNTEVYYYRQAEQKQKLRIEKGYSNDAFMMFYAAEFNKNKNQRLLIQAMALIKDTLPNAKLLLAGDGTLLEESKALARDLGVAGMIEFLGYRNDIAEIMPMCDVAVASSLREGLPVNIMEAMSCGLPILASDNRGHRELVSSNVNGWIVHPEDAQTLAEKIQMLANNRDLLLKWGAAGRKRIEQRYALQHVLKEQCSIYVKYMEHSEVKQWAVQ